MAQMSVQQFASELGVTALLLLEQLKAAGVDKAAAEDALTEQDKTKRTFLDEWVRAVNTHGGFGRWSWAVSFNPSDIADLVAGVA